MSPAQRPQRAKRTIVIKPPKELDASINVTPLVDVVLVLLIIFMVVTPLIEQDLAVQLSTEQRTDKEEEIEPTQVLVSVDGTGMLQINAQPVSRADYVAELRKRLSGRSPEDQVVFVVAGDSANYASLVEAIDRAKQAGATAVGLAADAVPEQVPPE